MEEGSVASRLRLSSARRRIDAFIEQIDVLAASSFPHEDGKKVLAAIRSHCRQIRTDLDLPSTTRDDVIDQLCQRLLDDVAMYTELLGFILRSTNVRNPFELHFVVRKLVTQAVGEDINLLISSEWNYNPFTYPMSVDQLADTILIGTPAPEANNPHLIPLAGHEVGHSAWRVYACAPRYTLLVTETVKAELETNPSLSKALYAASPLRALDKDRVINRCAGHVLQQLEEVFCDVFGLFLFGHGYLAAFDYLLGPGNFVRDLDYPSDGQRMAFLQASANILGIIVEPELVDRWVEGQVSRADRPMAAIADAVVERLVPKVRDDLIADLVDRGLSPPDVEEEGAVLRAFQAGEPYPERAGLGAIISAGWRRLRELDVLEAIGDHEGWQQDSRQKSYGVLADLVLKTVEIAEYHDRIAGDA